MLVVWCGVMRVVWCDAMRVVWCDVMRCGWCGVLWGDAGGVVCLIENLEYKLVLSGTLYANPIMTDKRVKMNMGKIGYRGENVGRKNLYDM